MVLYQGNASEDGREYGGWFVGDLLAWNGGGPSEPPIKGLDLRATQALEVKWGRHPAGQPRPGGWAAPTEKTTLSLLVQGRFRLLFRLPGQTEPFGEQLLEQPGDYVIWRETIEHRWQAVQDSVILTVRWTESPDRESETDL